MEIIKIGTKIQQREGFSAFIPDSFPPQGISFSSEILKKDAQATHLLGKLDGITKLLPDADFFLLMYLRKDAASSSQIEGTKATMINAIEAEANIGTNVPKDVDDILHYIKALNYGMRRIKDDEFPITLRFIREVHEKLMHQARKTHFSNPGEFRRSQNWIGGTKPDNASYVPPPAHEMHRALGDLEKFINNKDHFQVVTKAAFIHAQFETIHPFLDGNGRTGRILIPFYLWQEGYLEKPVLFLSSYFKKHQKTYYEKLDGYHEGNVMAWVDFFLDGVVEIAKEAIVTVSKITELREKDMLKIQSLSKRSSESAIKVLPRLYAQPIVNVRIIREWTGFTRAGAQQVIDRFIEKGILVPKNKNVKYDQSYSYNRYLKIFSEGD